jgi:hypothetical protein
VDYSAIALPEDCGRRLLADKSFEFLNTHPPTDRATAVCTVIRANETAATIYDQWKTYVSKAKGKSRTQWIEHGSRLGILGKVSIPDLESLLADGIDEEARLSNFLNSEAAKALEASPARTSQALSLMLGNSLHPIRPPGVHFSVLRHLSRSLGNLILVPWTLRDFPGTLMEALSHALGGRSVGAECSCDMSSASVGKNTTIRQCIEVIRLIEDEVRRPAVEWTQSLGPLGALY